MERVRFFRIPVLRTLVAALLLTVPLVAQVEEEEVAADSAPANVEEEYESITSEDCGGCHEESNHGTLIVDDLEHSVHDFLTCLDCHTEKGTFPHSDSGLSAHAIGCQGCRDCHVEAAEQYQAHGRSAIGDCEDIPTCASCHGDHDILPSTAKLAKTHPVNLPATCGKCHEDLNLTTKYEILIDHPIEIYEASVHGQAAAGGIYLAATCNDCHSSNGTAHRILAPGDPESAIHHFNIPKTCGKCHRSIENDYWEGIHGKLAARGEVDSPVCTHCHGEHGIISPDDPQSPVSRAHVAEMTCSPCHESAVLNEKYGLRAGRLATFIDSYHGLKTKAGDPHVANCASCHGVHRILPSSDPTSTIHPDNLQSTCGDCHPRISVALAQSPIHGISGEGLHTTVADVVEKIYIVAIVVIIGLMVLHWLIDLGRQIILMMRRKPQVRRMRPHELLQHTLLMITFIALVISGFALRFNEGWMARFFFGWDGGFEARGLMHRIAAILFVLTVVWHAVFLFSVQRGRAFVQDMWPRKRDFTDFVQRILYNLGMRRTTPRFPRFSYIEKAEYWALVWGTAVMILTGFLLWFDYWFIGFLPKGFLDVALVIHYWEAWLATLAIAVWHLYSTVFNPHVYPMNPSWLTGTMPEEMYRHEHPEHVEEAKQETEEWVKAELDKMSPDLPGSGVHPD
jgi:cytochrome b subunit of formate dehydrogenase